MDFPHHKFRESRELNAEILRKQLQAKKICQKYNTLRCLKQDYESPKHFDPLLERLLAMINQSSMTLEISFRLAW